MRFTDTPEDYWAYEAINDLADKGIITGYEDNSFKPENSIIRAEFFVMLGRTCPDYDENVRYECPFTDCQEDTWYRNIIAFCYTKGYIRGYEDNTFRADQNITRAEVAAAISRRMGD